MTWSAPFSLSCPHQAFIHLIINSAKSCARGISCVPGHGDTAVNKTALVPAPTAPSQCGQCKVARKAGSVGTWSRAKVSRGQENLGKYQAMVQLSEFTMV